MSSSRTEAVRAVRGDTSNAIPPRTLRSTRRARASISGLRRTRVRTYSAPMYGLNRLADMLKRIAYCMLFDRSDVDSLNHT